MAVKKEKYIIYVEDDPDDQMLFKETLDSHQNYDLLTLVNGFELLNYLKHRKQNEFPCLIVLDINMPVMNGLEALAILKSNENLKQIPSVMFSTSAKPDDVEYCKKFDTEIILKPSSFKEMDSIFRKMLKFCEAKV